MRTEIELPPAFHRLVIAPASQTLRAPGGTAEVVSTGSGGKYVVTDELQTVPVIVPPADYPALLRTESALREKAAKVFLLEKR